MPRHWCFGKKCPMTGEQKEHTCHSTAHPGPSTHFLPEKEQFWQAGRVLVTPVRGLVAAWATSSPGSRFYPRGWPGLPAAGPTSRTPSPWDTTPYSCLPTKSPQQEAMPISLDPFEGLQCLDLELQQTAQGGSRTPGLAWVARPLCSSLDTEPGLCTGGRPGSAPPGSRGSSQSGLRRPGEPLALQAPSESHTAPSQVRSAGASTQSVAAGPQAGDCEHVTTCVSHLCAHVDGPSYPFCYFWLFRV